MRKRVIKSFVLLVLTAVLSVCAWASVASGVCGESLRWKLYEDGLFEIRGSGAMLDYGGVTRVPWEELKSRIKTIEIKSGAAGIGAKAFYDCDNLTSIVFSETVTSIGEKAFGDCLNLTELKLPGSLMYIETGAFYNCNRIASITVEENSTFFSNDENGVLFDKDKTRLVLYPAGCTATEYVIPDGVINIADSAFENSIYLTNVVIPNGVEKIGDDAFNGAEQLTSINMPDSVTRVGDRAFAGCVGLTTVEISGGIERIGEKAFLGCDNITTVYYGGTKEQWRYVTIEPHNDSLLNAEIIFGEEMPTAPKTAADGTCGTNLTWTLSDDGVLTVSGEGKMEDWEVFSYVPWYSYGESIHSVVIKGGVTSIGIGAFANCTGLISIQIPDSVTGIGECAFRNCSSLTSIAVDENNWYYSSDDRGALFNEDKTILIQYPTGNTAANYKIPSSVTSIGDGAFDGCTGLESIEIPESVTSIGREAFFGCTGLEIIQIPDGVTSIGGNTFAWCNNLTSIEIPDGVTSIGDYAFARCDNLTSIEIPESVTSITDNVFTNCPNLTICGYAGSTAESHAISNGIPFSIVKVGKYGDLTYKVSAGEVTITGCEKAATGELVIPSTIDGYPVTSIGEDAFRCCYITSIEIPDSVTGIGNCAFLECYNLTSIEIPDSVTSIGRFAFQGCGITSIEIPDSVTNLGSRAFNRSSITSIKLPEGVTSIEGFAFEFCTRLESIEIPNSVTSIGDWAFSDCYSLTSIEIPNSVTSIGNGAFAGCENLTIYGDGGTYAHFYATVNQIPFKSLIHVTVNGAMVEFPDQKPVIEDGRTLVPARGVFEALGAVVTWDDSTKTATVKTDEKEIAVQIGSNYLVVNGEVIEIDVPAKIINGRTMIPLRAVAEALDCEVGWDGATYTAFISK